MVVSIAGGVKPGKLLEIEAKLYRLLIVGKQKSGAMLDGLDEEIEAHANKLAVERDAVLDRLEKQLQSRQIFEAVSSQLSEAVRRSIDFRLAEPADVLRHTKISEQQIMLLELLQSSAPDMNQLYLYVNDLSWLVHDLTNLVNSPSFRAKRPNRSDVKVSDLKLVLSFIGIENLQTLIPYFCVRRWLPSGHPNLLWTTRKLWRYNIVTAIASQTLATAQGKDAAFAYICALQYQLGTSAILNNSAEIFEQIWGSWLREAENSKEREVYDAVLATEFPANQVYEKVMEYELELNWQLLDLLGFGESRITEVLRELSYTMRYADLSEDAALIARGNAFAKILFLEEQRKLYPQERELIIDYYQFTPDEIELLRGQNYRKLDLV
ncbi:HDOD domain-containing protein [Shewanella corallii]|uniref:HDOD domain-containing protein n=1 Tax=Shewanella corallii TaxID=560080 RepID=A0ABT0NBW5_9GAMM|nr:HDOD domain-containing protein [Shewanella corallii]